MWSDANTLGLDEYAQKYGEAYTNMNAYWRYYQERQMVNGVQVKRPELIISGRVNGGYKRANEGTQPVENMPQEYLGVINDLALSTATAYNSLDNNIKRHYAHKLSKRTNLKSGKIFQTAKSFGKSSAKILGKTANIIAVGSIAYDFGTGDANTATLVDAGILVGGVVAVVVLGTVAAPYVIAAGVVYGVGSLFGFDII